MAIVMPKQENPIAELGYVKLFLNQDGNLASIDENGIVNVYAKGTRVDTVFSAMEEFNITPQLLVNKKITLQNTPMNKSVRLSIPGCLDQIENEGFYVDGNDILWDNMGLDGFLDESDVIQVYYSYYN